MDGCPPRGFDTLMGSLQVCGSVRIVSTGNTLTMRVWNLEGMPGGQGGVQHTMTAIGLYHSGSPWTGKVNSYTVRTR